MAQSDLDPLLHQPIRTRLTAYLVARGKTTLTELKQELGVTDGNLEAHIKKLLAAGHLQARKQHGKDSPQTHDLLSEQGMQAFQAYIHTLQALLPEQKTEPVSDVLAPRDLSNPSLKRT